MNISQFIVGCIAGMAIQVATATPTVSDVVAQQRYPWNGLVDITVTIQGAAAEVAEYVCVFAATNSATKAVIPVRYISQNGEDTGSGNVWTRKFIWDAKADVGAVKIDDVALIVDIERPLGGVQLWEDGPYWAECNVGASKPEECGYYFWWGDTVGYKRNANNDGWISVKDSKSFSFSEGNCPTYDKDNSQLQSDGYIDATGNLVAAHDAATAHLGAPWRMPTDAEFSALINNCDIEWTSRNGISGWLVKGSGAYASKSIFLPATGFGHDSYLYDLDSGSYWSSTPNSVGYYGVWDLAWRLGFTDGYFGRNYFNRYDGFSVRPVRSSVITGGVTTHMSLDFSLSVTSVTAQQRYPWNGLVDITVTLRGMAEDVADSVCTFAATNSATKAAIPVDHITQNGEDVGSGNVWTRKYIWDAKTDVGAVKIDDVALTVDAFIGVQLWSNGPYWATCNVGASQPEECGYYFWWGDTVGYKCNASNNGWNSVKDSTSFSFSDGNCPTYGKNNSQLQLEGYIDATGNLVAAHDAATAHLGDPWRMPTDAEISALIDKCTTTWTSRNGVYGRLVKGRGAYASKSIFLPAACYGYDSSFNYLGSYGDYWSSTPNSDYSNYAWDLSFGSGGFGRGNDRRYDRQSVRPVRGFANVGTSARTMTEAAVTTHFALDCREGVREVSAGGEDLCYDVSWYANGDQVCVTDNGELIETGSVGTKHWMPADSLCHHLQMTVVNGDGMRVGGEDAYFVSPTEDGDVVIPDGWSELPANMFKGCDWLKSVTIPSSVTNIAATAFAGCVNLTNVVLHRVSVSRQIVPELVEGTKWTEEPETLDGNKVYKSNPIGFSQETSIEFNIPRGYGELTFSWKVGSEQNYDWLTWYLDDAPQGRISGSQDWASITYDLDGGLHRLKFVYSEDLMVSVSPDCGWVSVHGSDQKSMLLKDIFPDSPVATVTIGDEISDLLDRFFAGCSELMWVIFEGEAPPNASDAVFEGAPSDLKVCVRTPSSDWSEALVAGEWYGRKVVPHWISGVSMGLSADDVVTSGGDAFWRDVEDSGVSAFASGEIGDSQESWLEVAIPGPAHVSFDWRVSCEESALDDSDEEVFFDGLEFLVDGETVGTIAGETDWATVSLDLTDAGPHAIRWRYFKDDAYFEGDDGGAIANLVVTPYATVTFAAGGDAAGDPPVDVTCLVGTSVSLPSAGSLAWAKHRFVGWSDGEAVYQPGAEYEVTKVDTAFTAVWEEKHLATPTITVPAVFAADTVEVVISAESGASVYYTVDGSDPTDASLLYAEPFSVADDCTVRAIALRDDWFDSVVATATTQKATYTVRFDAGSCGVISSGDAVQTVKYGGAAVAPTVGPDAWHAFDGWDKPFDRVTGDLTVTANYRLAARAVSDVDCYVDRGVTSSETGVGAYLDDAAEDGCVIRMTEDAAWCAIAVEGYCRVSCAIDPEDVVCTVDGEERAIVVNLGRMVVEVIGEGSHEVRWTGKAQLSDFEVVSAALLSFAAAGGETGDVPAPIAMYEGDEVTLPGAGSLVLAKHRFVGWRDGEAVLPPKSVYAGSLETKTLTAVWEEKRLATPVIDAPEYFEAESAQVILNAEDGAEIRYTLDGTALDVSSALYEGPFAVDETVTIRAIALRDDWFDSAVAERQVVRGPWTFGEYLEMPEQTFSTSGDAEWVRAKGEGEDGEGSYALRSGAIGDSQESVLSMKVQGAGTVTFKYCVSSQAKKGVISDGLAVRLDGSDEKAFKDGGDTGWKEAEVSVVGAGEHTVAWVYWKNASGADGADCAWLDSVKWTPAGPSVADDPSAVVTGDAESGYVVVPSADLEQVEVELNGIDPSKVTVEVSPKVMSVKPNGAKVKIVSGGVDITEFLNVPAADGNGVVDLSKATVKEEIVKEAMDPAKGAEIKLDAANPTLITPNTRVGLFYQLREGTTLEGMSNGDSTIGDGNPWKPEIKVKGGNSAFYSIGVGKGE